MKKRLLSALLALALVFVLLPTTALADTTPVTDENVKINGTAVIVGNDISLGEGNGTYSYDKATHTLTLNSATINATTGNIGISFGVPVKRNIDYKIELVGKNTITSTSAQAIYVEYDTSVDASLNDTMKRSTLTINGSAGSSLSLNVSGTGSKEAIEAIWSKGDFTLSGGTAVTAFSSDKIAVNVGSMTINNSKLSAQSSSYGTTVVLYGFEMIGDAAEFEALNTSSGVRAVLRTSGASENIDWSKYQLITGSYSGNALTKSEPTVCDKNTLNDLFSSSSTTRYIHIAKRTIALETTSDVRIAGGPAVVGQKTSLGEGKGYYTYDATTHTLTLENVNITSVINAIQFAANGDYTIRLEGTNTISDVSNGISVTDDKYITSLNVTITGTGSLDISARGLAINMKKGDLKFENTGEIKLTTSNISPTHNVLSVSGNITIADMEKYKVEGIVQDNTNDGGDTVTLSEASHLKGYQNPGDTQKTCLKSITIAPKPSETYYNNTAMKYGETRTVGNGTISCDENGVITLNGVTEGTLEFRSSSDSTLVLEGTNTLSSIVTTQKSLTISGSGSGSLTVGSIKVHNQKTSSDDKPNLTITGGAQVTVNRPSNEDLRAIDIDGDLTVINSGSLTATSNSTKPTVQVGGNATFTGSTVTITNNSTEPHKDATEATKGDSVSSALYVKGNINITDNANVTAKVENGGGNAIGALGNITVNGSTVTAVNKGQKFTTIIAKNVYVSGESTITANNLNGNPPYNGSYLAFPAIEGNIVNQNTDYSLKFEGQHNRSSVPKTTLAPGEQTTLYYYNVTITRGDEVTHTASPVVIAGTTLLNDTYYTITNGSTVAEGTDSNNYNAFYDSETKTLKLNNASINGTGVKAIEANVGGYTFTIELVGNNIIKTSGSANNVIDITGNLYFTGSGTAEVSGKGTPIYATYKIDVSADVTITNTEKAGSFTYSANSEYSNNYVGANTFAIGSGYKAYASIDGTTWAVYDNTTASENESYTTLRITKENLAPTTTVISKITVAGLTPPVKGATPVDKSNVTLTEGMTVESITWGPAESIIDGKFIAGKSYTAHIKYTVDKGYEFAANANCPQVNGADVTRWHQEGMPQDEIEVTFHTAADTPTEKPTITVSMPTPVAGNTPATANDITLTYSDINKSVSKKLSISNVVWQSYVSNSDMTITPGETLSSGDKFEAGKTYFVRITHEYVAGEYDIVPAAGITLDYTESDSTYMMLLFYTTGAPCTHEYTNDWHANGNTHWHECKLCRAHADEAEHTYGGWITDTEPTATVAGTKHRVCSVCDYVEQGNIPATGEIVPPTPDNPGTIVIIRPAEEEKPAQQPNPSTGANDLVGLAVAAAVAAALGSAALLRKHD